MKATTVGVLCSVTNGNIFFCLVTKCLIDDSKVWVSIPIGSSSKNIGILFFFLIPDICILSLSSSRNKVNIGINYLCFPSDIGTFVFNYYFYQCFKLTFLLTYDLSFLIYIIKIY